MTIQYCVTEEDYINFNVEASIRVNKRMLAIFRFGIPVLLLAIVLINIVFNELSIIDFALVVMSLILIIWFPVFFKNSLRKQILKFIKLGRSNDFIGEQTMILEDTYIKSFNKSGEGKTQYSVVESIRYFSNIYCIYVGSIKAFVVPESAFTDEAQKREFFDILFGKTGIYPPDMGYEERAL